MAVKLQGVFRGGWSLGCVRWDSVIQEMSCRVEAWHTNHPEQPGLPLEELRALAEQFFPSHDLFQELTTDLCGKVSIVGKTMLLEIIINRSFLII